MLESERREHWQELTSGADVPSYDVELRFWRYQRSARSLLLNRRSWDSTRLAQILVELPGRDGHTLFAEFGPIVGIDPGRRDDLIVIGWPVLGGVIGLRYPEGGRQICEQPLTTRRPRQAVLIG